MSAPGCYLCGTPKGIRPYGPRGQMICFACMTADPEREAEARRQFGAQLGEAAQGGVAMLDGSNAGPVPFHGTRKPS